jgi:predicted cation transporter
MVLALGLILLAVLLEPVLIKPVERNIEVFFLAVGALAAAVSGQWSWALLHAAVTEPVALTIAVLVLARPRA